MFVCVCVCVTGKAGGKSGSARDSQQDYTSASASGMAEASLFNADVPREDKSLSIDADFGTVRNTVALDSPNSRSNDDDGSPPPSTPPLQPRPFISNSSTYINTYIYP